MKLTWDQNGFVTGARLIERALTFSVILDLKFDRHDFDHTMTSSTDNSLAFGFTDPDGLSDGCDYVTLIPETELDVHQLSTRLRFHRHDKRQLWIIFIDEEVCL